MNLGPKARITLASIAFCVVLLGAEGLRQVCGGAMRQEAASVSGEPTPVLVELFTSEGCSSCPPADLLLIHLERTQPVTGARIIALGQHVDYWDRLGWKDPFSSAEFSRRQEDYAQALRARGVYTPQMVVDGQFEFVGSNSRDAEKSILLAARTPKGRVQISPTEREQGSLRVEVWVRGLPAERSKSVDVFLAVTETGLASQVARGENSGRRLEHTAVVRRLRRLGSLEREADGAQTFTATVEPEAAWSRENLRLVAFVQDRNSRRVLAVAEQPLHPQSGLSASAR
jgi:hypothetical protein